MNIDFDPAIRKSLKHKAVDEEVSVNYLVNAFCASGLGLPPPPRKKSGPKKGKGRKPPAKA